MIVYLENICPPLKKKKKNVKDRKKNLAAIYVFLTMSLYAYLARPISDDEDSLKVYVRINQQ